MLVDDTIAALSTPFGEGALAVVRVSGPEAHAIADRVFRGGRVAHRTAAFGRIVDAEGVVDEVVLTAYHAPASYTGEDVVEISGHGGVLVSARVLQAVLQAGARAAGSGEFTQRAFLNGKMDLTQAEAVMDLIRAQTPLAARAAAEQLAGRIGSEILAIREAILDVVAHVEAHIDFPDEDIDPDTGAALQARIEAARERIARLLETANEGRILREGVRLAICGRPNAGKSSLLNRLAGYERAIVSPTPGTTRDTIEEVLNLRGIPFRVIDTAGLRETPDAIEREGVRRAREAVAAADIVLRVIDATDPGALADPAAAENEIVALNKCDLVRTDQLPPSPLGLPQAAVSTLNSQLAVSCATGAGIDALVDAIAARVRTEPMAGRDSLAAVNARHQACLFRAEAALVEAATKFAAGEAPEFVALDLRVALDAAGEVVGVVDTDDILGRIFGSFCIGK
jgi:tRNA modification GTPase